MESQEDVSSSTSSTTNTSEHDTNTGSVETDEEALADYTLSQMLNSVESFSSGTGAYKSPGLVNVTELESDGLSEGESMDACTQVSPVVSSASSLQSADGSASMSGSDSSCYMPSAGSNESNNMQTADDFIQGVIQPNGTMCSENCTRCESDKRESVKRRNSMESSWPNPSDMLHNKLRLTTFKKDSRVWLHKRYMMSPELRAELNMTLPPAYEAAARLYVTTPTRARATNEHKASYRSGYECDTILSEAVNQMGNKDRLDGNYSLDSQGSGFESTQQLGKETTASLSQEGCHKTSDDARVRQRVGRTARRPCTKHYSGHNLHARRKVKTEKRPHSVTGYSEQHESETTKQ